MRYIIIVLYIYYLFIYVEKENQGLFMTEKYSQVLSGSVREKNEIKELL